MDDNDTAAADEEQFERILREIEARRQETQPGHHLTALTPEQLKAKLRH